MKVYVTKNALTRGIEELEVELVPGTSMVRTPNRESGYTQYLHGEGKEWHRTFEAAQIKARELKDKKIISLHRALKKLQETRF